MSNEKQLAYQSALMILMPEAEALVRTFREQYDPSAKVGVPAHITLNYPFQPANSRSPQAIYDALGELFFGFPVFHCTLREIRRFPQVIYLAPEPDHPFKTLIQAIVDQYPESPPYEGKFAEAIPHLTIAQLSDETQLADIGHNFEIAIILYHRNGIS